MKRLLPLLVVVVAAGMAALAVNLLLVDYASGTDDPVGNLSPRATLPGAPTERGTTRTETRRDPTTSADDRVTELTEPTLTDGDDDGGKGRGRNRGRGGDGREDDD